MPKGSWDLPCERLRIFPPIRAGFLLLLLLLHSANRASLSSPPRAQTEPVFSTDSLLLIPPFFLFFTLVLPSLPLRFGNAAGPRSSLLSAVRPSIHPFAGSCLLASACPRWHRTALWLGWSSSLVLGAAVLALGSWVHHLQTEKPGNVMEGRGDVAPADCRNVMPVDCRDATPADCGDAVARDRQHLREALCPPQGQDPAEGDGCQFCPPGWTRRGHKCYWVADKTQSWNKSQENCTSWDAELLMPEDCDELEFVKDIAKKPSKYFWINLSGPDRSQILLNGSCLDQSGLPPGSSKGCRALKDGRILAESCDSAISWICQKAAIAI